VQFAGFGGVDHVEQPGEAVAQIEAAPAAMAQVEYPAQFHVELFFVEEIGVLPINRVTDRRFKTAFGHGGSPSRFKTLGAGERCP